MSVETLAGVRPSAIGLQVLRGTARPILPDTRDQTLVVPGKNGEWDFGADVGPRQITLECAFMEASPALLQQRVETLAGLLVDAFGKPKTIDLVLSVHPDRTYKARYSGSLAIDRIVGMGRFSLPLIAFDPYAVGTEQVFETTVTTSPYTTTIQSLGEIRTPPVIVLVNQGSNTITHFRIENEYQVE